MIYGVAFVVLSKATHQSSKSTISYKNIHVCWAVRRTFIDQTHTRRG
jgi:hypothetical protein